MLTLCFVRRNRVSTDMLGPDDNMLASWQQKGSDLMNTDPRDGPSFTDPGCAWTRYEIYRDICDLEGGHESGRGRACANLVGASSKR